MAARELARRALRRRASNRREPKLSFTSWERFPRGEPKVLQVCHPDWRGVRTATYAFQSPVVECDDLDYWCDVLLAGMASAQIETIVIQGWPPGAGRFSQRCRDRGMSVKAVIHSSPAQHGAELSEAAAADGVLDLLSTGVLRGVGVVKYGVAEALDAVGHPVTYLPNRAPLVPGVTKLDFGPGLHVGVFAEPFWRKNVVTQIVALAMLENCKGHVMTRPSIGYLKAIDIQEHGELPWDEFMALQGSVDLNLYVTLTECHPLSPIESYLLGVPCLMSRTSAVFRDDPDLWEMTTVDKPDEPTAIAAAARSLLDYREEAVARAMTWIRRFDQDAAALWSEFTQR